MAVIGRGDPTVGNGWKKKLPEGLDGAGLAAAVGLGLGLAGIVTGLGLGLAASVVGLGVAVGAGLGLAAWVGLGVAARGLSGATVLGLAGGEEGGKLPRLVKIRNPWGNSFEWRVRLSSSKSP